MAFWGIEVKPDSPYIYRSDENGRLHVSQATLGDGFTKKKTMVQCQVGSKKPIYLCSLFPERLETCALNLEFEEDDQVTFSVIGIQSVHLSGFFYGDNEDQDEDCCGYGSDRYEEDVMGTDSEEEDDYFEYDSEDEDESDDFDYPPSSAANSGVRIEEIVDDEKPANGDDIFKRAKKQKTRSRMSDGNENSDRQIVLKAGNGAPILESEDEDGFPISGNKSGSSNSEPRLEETADKIVGEKTEKSKGTGGVACGEKSKEKIDADRHGNEAARENVEPHGSIQPDTVISGSEIKQKKNKKRKAAEESAQGNEMQSPNSTEEPPVREIGNDPKPSAEKKKEKKKKKKQKEGQQNMPTLNAEDKQIENKASMVQEQDKEEAKSLQVRTFSNGLVIEELAMGKPDGKRASPGKKVSVHYIGKLKKNGKIFDSNIGRAPFKFRLGIGQVIKGWDVGVSGMRVGDKRRLTIPPSMGYGSKGVAAIPPNSWLVFDVELVDVN